MYLNCKSTGSRTASINQDIRLLSRRLIGQGKLKRLVKTLSNSRNSDTKSRSLLKADIIRDLDLDISFRSGVISKRSVLMVDFVTAMGN